MVELRGSLGVSVEYRKRKPVRYRRIPDGTLAEPIESIRPDDPDIPRGVPFGVEVDQDGQPLPTQRDITDVLGQPVNTTFAMFNGWFRFPDGGVFAVYGAVPDPIRGSD